MTCLWRHEARSIGPVCTINAELDTAKEILAEIFHARPADIDDMIKRRLEEDNYIMDQARLADKGLWPATFCLCE